MNGGRSSNGTAVVTSAPLIFHAKEMVAGDCAHVRFKRVVNVVAYGRYTIHGSASVSEDDCTRTDTEAIFER